jgi:uncharacterized protein YyaL (SSP411 family)
MQLNKRKPNRLIKEKSPYLLQHAYNPVDWYPWCDEAFEKAKKEDKPIFLSIGYSTCHWCHVMERESFEDEEIAKILNENFVCIKVDREERPDIDQFYMNICVMVRGHGGWPLTIIMTPDKKPFFVGTYFPKESTYYKIGLKDLLLQLSELWKKEKDKVLTRADQILKNLKLLSKQSTNVELLNEEDLNNCYLHFKDNFDPIYGGFGKAPKFPSPQNLMFLMRYYYFFKEKKALEMAVKTLKQMAKGGIFDHVGYGFHRYSTDNLWLLPHFEKMLYDQAMLLLAYTEAYQITKNEDFKKIVEKIIVYLIRDMENLKGAFYSAEDADSEGEEGKFYTWEYKELEKILEDDFEVFKKISNIKPEGNYREEATNRPSGRNIIHISRDWQELSLELGKSPEEIKEVYNRAIKKLFEARENRIRPLKDTKILTDWNGMVIKALSKAGRFFNIDEYIEIAKRTADFIISNLYKDGVLYHRYKDGEAKVKGNLDDYAFLIWGLIGLYQSTFEDKYLEIAINLTDKAISLFWDYEESGFFFSSKDNKDILIRQKELYDSAYPSGNSIMYNNLVDLFKMTSDLKYKRYIESMEKLYSYPIKKVPFGSPMFLIGFMNMLKPIEIVASGDKNKTLAILKDIDREFIPNKTQVLKSEYTTKLSDFIKNIPDSKSPLFYICRDFTCSQPVKTKEEILKEIRE